MGRVSKKVIHSEFKSELDDQVGTLIESLVNKNEVNQFLNEFLTKEEKVMLGKRVVLYMMLEKGFSNSQIQQSLLMSYETIRLYKYFFESRSILFKKKIRRLIAIEKNKQLWKKLDKLFEPLTLALQSKSNMRARAKLLQGGTDES